MPTSFASESAAVLPPEMPREQIIKHIQKYETIIRVNPNLDHFKRLYPEKIDHVFADPFFASDQGGADIVTFEIYERLPILPLLGISKVIKFPVYYQNFSNGIRARVDAGWGTTVWASYVVRPLDGAELRRGAWRLVEEVRVECNALVKPFVRKTCQEAHKNLCQRIVDGLVAEGQTANPT